MQVTNISHNFIFWALYILLQTASNPGSSEQ